MIEINPLSKLIERAIETDSEKTYEILKEQNNIPNPSELDLWRFSGLLVNIINGGKNERKIFEK